MQLDHPSIIGDVRGKGFMIGIELVSDPETRKPLPVQEVLELFEDIKDMGVLVGKGGLRANVSTVKTSKLNSIISNNGIIFKVNFGFQVLRIKPPMCVTKADADFTVEVINRAVHNSKHRRWQNKEESVFLNGV